MPWRRIIRVAVVAAYGVLLVAGAAGGGGVRPVARGLLRMFCGLSVFLVSALLGFGAALGERRVNAVIGRLRKTLSCSCAGRSMSVTG